jgi:NTP pyrophosphatase (non-canonical NTP hydrolase)
MSELIQGVHDGEGRGDIKSEVWELLFQMLCHADVLSHYFEIIKKI